MAGLMRRRATGWRTPLAPSSPSRVPSLETRMLARAAPCASRPLRLHEYQKKGPATAAPTAKAPMSTTTQAAAICSPRQCHPPLRALPSPMATSGKRPRRRHRYGRYQVLHAFVTSRVGFVPATGESAVTLSYRYLLPAAATEQAVEQAALRRLRLRRRRLRPRRRPLRQLVLRRQHRTRHRAPLSLGADRGVHLVPLRLVVHRPQGTPHSPRLLSYARGRHVLRPRLRAADPTDLGRRCLPRRPRPRKRGWQQVRRVPGSSGGWKRRRPSRRRPA